MGFFGCILFGKRRLPNTNVVPRRRPLLGHHLLGSGGYTASIESERLRQETQMPVHLAESPLTCVAVGSGKYLEEFDVLVKSKRNSRPRGR